MTAVSEQRPGLPSANANDGVPRDLQFKPIRVQPREGLHELRTLGYRAA